MTRARFVRSVVIAMLCAACVACNEAPDDPVVEGTPPRDDLGDARARDWPEGTVLAIDDQPILASEVDAVARAIGELYPEYVLAQNRRLAIHNLFAPLLAVRSRDGKAREEALAAAEAARAAAGPDGAPEGALEAEGTFHGLGLDLWLAARDLEPGVWSEPIEIVGRWVLLRLDAREATEEARTTRLTVQVASFPYLDLSYQSADDSGSSVDAAIESSVLRIIDAAWADFVPEALRYRMQSR